MASLRPFLRPQALRGIFSSSPLSLSTPQAIIQTSTRAASSKSKPIVPDPIPLVPDVETFLKIIGRNMKQHASKFPDWKTLFTLTSEELRDLGVEPPRSRKYLIRWRERFRLGQYGVAGDLKHVQDGVAQLRILEAEPKPGDTTPPRKVVVNIAPDTTLEECSPSDMSRVLGYYVRGESTIVGPYALPVNGGQGAQIALVEGMWEDRLGHKVDGGERRRAEVRYKRRIAERREARERDGR